MANHPSLPSIIPVLALKLSYLSWVYRKFQWPWMWKIRGKVQNPYSSPNNRAETTRFLVSNDCHTDYPPSRVAIAAFFPMILSSSGLLRQDATGWVAHKQQNVISHTPGSWESKLKAPQIPCLVRAHFPVPRWCLFSVLTWQKRWASSLGPHL